VSVFISTVEELEADRVNAADINKSLRDIECRNVTPIDVTDDELKALLKGKP